MTEYTDRWTARLRNAQRDLLKDIGVAKAMELTRRGKSEVYRWQSETDSDLLTIPLSLVLEDYAARPLITQVMADFHGRQLGDANERQARIADLRAQVGSLIGQVAHLMGREAHAGSDGFYSVSEINELIKLNGDVRRISEQLDDMLATAKAAGGLSIVGGKAVTA